jgi:hypothetical protein
VLSAQKGVEATEQQHYVAGIMLGQMRAHRSYKIELPEAVIKEEFENHVQRNYDARHAPVFANTGRAKAFREIFKLGHTYFHGTGGRVKHSPIQPVHKLLGLVSGLTQIQESTQLHTGKDFLNFIGFGLRNGYPVVFSYALVDEGLFCSETGRGFCKDWMSKHMMHARGRPAVRYSGTFRVCLANGTPILVVDNDSGTYRPNADDGPRLKTVFESCFPGLSVLMLNISDEQPMHTLSWLGPGKIEGEHTWVWKPVRYSEKTVVLLEYFFYVFFAAFANV